jgi:hypothetical protein
VKAIVVEFSDLAHQLVSQHTLMGSSTSIGEWIDGFKNTPVFFEYHRYFQTGDTKILEFLYTFLNFGKKLDYVDETFEKTALRGWLGIEQKLDGYQYGNDIVCALRTVVHTVLPPFSWRDLRPKFGPGSVAERGVRGRISKLCNLRYDLKIDRFLLHGHIGMYGMGGDLGLCAEKVIPDPSTWTAAKGCSSRTARLRFVPKNLKVSRSICMEPNTLMFFQQAALTRILELIADGPLCRFIDIRDQSRNQSLCFTGSFTSEIDTIDLSAASDSVSLELVRRIFPASWLIPMLTTRSERAIIPGDVEVSLKKFAPMGSALCFPTQCIIFASICILAACYHAYEIEDVSCRFLDWLTPERVLDICASFQRDVSYPPKGYQPLAVYGDDICVDRRLTPNVTSILSILGFEVNKGKSFVGSQSFRESCGKFYLDGHDITPLYFRVKGVRSKLTTNHVVSQVHLINECWKRGYKNTYRFLRRSLMAWDVAPLLRSRSSSHNSIPMTTNPLQFGILCAAPSNKHLEERVHKDYQRDEIRGWTITYDHRAEPGQSIDQVDAYEHMRWWAGRSELSTPDSSESVARYDTGGARLSWRWMPAQ